MREMAVATREVKLHHCALLPFFMDLAPIGSNLLPNMRKALESCVHADYEEMIASVMGMQDMLEIFYFKECLRAWVKSCDKFGNMNDDYIDKHFLSLSYLPIYAPSWSGRELFEHPSYIYNLEDIAKSAKKNIVSFLNFYLIQFCIAALTMICLQRTMKPSIAPQNMGDAALASSGGRSLKTFSWDWAKV